MNSDLRDEAIGDNKKNNDTKRTNDDGGGGSDGTVEDCDANYEESGDDKKLQG